MVQELQLPRASAAKVAYHMKQLRKMFARSSDIAFLQLIWATDALQSDRVEAASRVITFPPQAADSSVGSPFAIRRWELETLAIQLFLTPKEGKSPEVCSLIARSLKRYAKPSTASVR
jgi:hypothetical protein